MSFPPRRAGLRPAFNVLLTAAGLQSVVQRIAIPHNLPIPPRCKNSQGCSCRGANPTRFVDRTLKAGQRPARRRVALPYNLPIPPRCKNSQGCSCRGANPTRFVDRTLKAGQRPARRRVALPYNLPIPPRCKNSQGCSCRGANPTRFVDRTLKAGQRPARRRVAPAVHASGGRCQSGYGALPRRRQRKNGRGSDSLYAPGHFRAATPHAPVRSAGGAGRAVRAPSSLPRACAAPYRPAAAVAWPFADRPVRPPPAPGQCHPCPDSHSKYLGS